jgi:Tol biopolymer transport system component
MQLGNFSPDGQQIVYSRNYTWKNEGNCCEDYSILSYHPGTDTESLILPEAFEPDWSPDGNRITFRSNFGIVGTPAPGNIGIYEIREDSIIQLSKGPNNFQRPLWHPGGNEIIVLSDLPDQMMDYWEVLKYDLSTGEWSPLFENSSLQAINKPLSFSPDGKKLAFTDYKEDHLYRIQYADLENGITGTEVVSGWSDLNPSYSPDGKYLAFLSDRTGKNEIWLKELENERYQQLTGNEDYQIESELTWNPDSKKIYFKSYLDNQFGIYYIDI